MNNIATKQKYILLEYPAQYMYMYHIVHGLPEFNLSSFIQEIYCKQCVLF